MYTTSLYKCVETSNNYKTLFLLPSLKITSPNQPNNGALIFQTLHTHLQSPKLYKYTLKIYSCDSFILCLI